MKGLLLFAVAASGYILIGVGLAARVTIAELGVPLLSHPEARVAFAIPRTPAADPRVCISRLSAGA